MKDDSSLPPTGCRLSLTQFVAPRKKLDLADTSVGFNHLIHFLGLWTERIKKDNENRACGGGGGGWVVVVVVVVVVMVMVGGWWWYWWWWWWWW